MFCSAFMRVFSFAEIKRHWSYELLRSRFVVDSHTHPYFFVDSHTQFESKKTKTVISKPWSKLCSKLRKMAAR